MNDETDAARFMADQWIIIIEILDDEGNIKIIDYKDWEWEKLDKVDKEAEFLEEPLGAILKVIDDDGTVTYDKELIKSMIKKYNLKPGTRLTGKIEFIKRPPE